MEINVYHFIGGLGGMVAIGTVVTKVALAVKGKLDTKDAFDKFLEIKVHTEVQKRIEGRFNGVDTKLKEMHDLQMIMNKGVQKLVDSNGG